MTLTPATDDHVRALLPWFADRRSCAIWGGPTFRYPFTESTFLADTRFRDLPSYVLVDGEGQVLAFGSTTCAQDGATSGGSWSRPRIVVSG